MSNYDFEDYMMFTLGCCLCLLIFAVVVLISVLAYQVLFDPSSFHDPHYTIINGRTTTVAP